jgi:nitrogen fixation protein NifX
MVPKHDNYVWFDTRPFIDGDRINRLISTRFQPKTGRRDFSPGTGFASLSSRTGRNAVKVAFATNDATRVDASFEAATHIAVYDVGMFGHRLLECVPFSPDEDEMDDDSDRRFGAVSGSVILYVSFIEEHNAARIITRNIHPVQVDRAERIGDLLTRLSEKLAGTPPPWLRKAVQRDVSGYPYAASGSAWLM